MLRILGCSFSGFRAAALGYLWHCIEAADADSVVRSAAVATLANFHTGAMLPPVPARNMNFDPTAQSNRVVTAAEFAPLGVERIDALMGESGQRDSPTEPHLIVGNRRCLLTNTAPSTLLWA